ncbi:MAG: Ig-like domain-containing protein [Deinococcota bacterium]
MNLQVSREARILFAVLSVAIGAYVWVNFFAQFGFQSPFSSPVSQQNDAPLAQAPSPSPVTAQAPTTPNTNTPAISNTPITTPQVAPVTPAGDAAATIPVAVARDVEVITVPNLPTGLTGDVAVQELADGLSPESDAETIARLLEGIDGATINPFAAFASVTVPEQGQPVEVDSNILVTFSEPMQEGSTAAAFSASPPIACDFSFFDEGSTLVCDPINPLAEEQTYVITIAETATDLEGNLVGTDQQFSFLTGTATDTEAPTIVDRSVITQEDLTTRVEEVRAAEEAAEAARLAAEEAAALEQAALNGQPVVGIPPIPDFDDFDGGTIPAEFLPTPPTPVAITPPAPEPQVSQLPRSLPGGTLPGAPDVLRRSVQQPSAGRLPGVVALRVPTSTPAPLPRLSAPPTPTVRVPAATPAARAQEPLAQAPVPEPLTFASSRSGGTALGISPVAGTSSLAGFVRSNSITFTGAVQGPVNVGVFRSSQGSFSVVRGRALPNSTVILTDVSAEQATLTQGGESLTLPLSP